MSIGGIFQIYREFVLKFNYFDTKSQNSYTVINKLNLKHQDLYTQIQPLVHCIFQITKSCYDLSYEH